MNLIHISTRNVVVCLKSKTKVCDKVLTNDVFD